MARIFHLVLVATLSCLSLVAIGQVVCPIEGQIYYPPPMCAPCDGTCEIPNPVCTLDCKPGCACGEGRVIHENKCIDKSRCPPECPIKGQIYYPECAPCDGTCKNPNPVCTLECKPGCACPAGQVIRKKPTMCVNKTDCPRKCPIKGQIYYQYPECAPCDGTCKNPNPVCPLVCKSGCACPRGKVIKKGKKCVKPEKC